MIQLTLKLNSKKPATVYAVNGKTYSLKPGSNTLNLEYEEYLSLAKALGIKPVDNKKDEIPVPVTEVKEDTKPTKECAPMEEAKEEPMRVEESLVAEKEHETEEVSAEEQALEAESENYSNENNVTEETTDTKEVDYSTWTLKQLKAKYKELTGETCRLKKDDVISFLQEHHA